MQPLQGGAMVPSIQCTAPEVALRLPPLKTQEKLENSNTILIDFDALPGFGLRGCDAQMCFMILVSRRIPDSRPQGLQGDCGGP